MSVRLGSCRTRCAGLGLLLAQLQRVHRFRHSLLRLLGLGWQCLECLLDDILDCGVIECPTTPQLSIMLEAVTTQELLEIGRAHV